MSTSAQPQPIFAAPEAITLRNDRPATAPRGLPRVSCVLPCHNEQDNLELLLPLLRDMLTENSRAWEIILVDDGSTDGTAALMARWSQLPRFRIIQLSRNFGKEAALTAGLQAAHGDVVVTMDADMQHSPSLIPAMIQKWQNGADVVYAVREHRNDEPPLKRLGTRWFYKLLNLSDRVNVPEDAGDFRLMDRAVVNALLSLPERNRFMKGLYAWIGFNPVALPYTPEVRTHGRSHYSLLRLIRFSLDGLTAFTMWPLHVVSIAGFVLAMLAFAYGGYLTINYLLYEHPVSGWTTIVVAIMLFAGVQLISVGIVGEYLGRIFEEVKGRPLFVIKRESGRGLDTEQS